MQQKEEITMEFKDPETLAAGLTMQKLHVEDVGSKIIPKSITTKEGVPTFFEVAYVKKQQNREVLHVKWKNYTTKDINYERAC